MTRTGTPKSSMALRIAVGVLVVFAVLTHTLPAAASTPREVVEGFHDALLAVWKQSNTLTIEERFERLDAPVQEAFDLPGMIKIATGPAWRSASEAERAALVAAFVRYTVATYASRFKDYGDQSFQTIEEREGPGGRTVIDTRIVMTDDDPVPLSYVVGGTEERPQIVDVVAKGVSELARLRSDYRSILKSEGPAGLTTRIDALATKFLTE